MAPRFIVHIAKEKNKKKKSPLWPDTFEWGLLWLGIDVLFKSKLNINQQLRTADSNPPWGGGVVRQ